MNTPTPRDIMVHWFTRVWQERSKAAIYELMGDDVTVHQAGGTTVQGPVEFDGFHDQLLTAFPDLSLEILHAVGDDTHAVLHWQVSGTHTGDFLAIPATQEPVLFTGMSLAAVKDGRMTEAWDCWDQTALINKLAAIHADQTAAADG